MSKQTDSKAEPCKTCGTCPTCGSGPAVRYVYPQITWYPYYPYQTYPYPTWGYTSGIGQATAGIGGSIGSMGASGNLTATNTPINTSLQAWNG